MRWNRVMKLRGIDATVADFLGGDRALRRAGVHLHRRAGACRRADHLGDRRAGAAGLAVGLALQGSLSNFAAGVLLVIFRPLRVGNMSIWAAWPVPSIRCRFSPPPCVPRTTKPSRCQNGKIIAGNIINYSREPNRRVDIVVGVAYNADIDVVKKVLGDVIAADKRIMHAKGRDHCV